MTAGPSPRSFATSAPSCRGPVRDLGCDRIRGPRVALTALRAGRLPHIPWSPSVDHRGLLKPVYRRDWHPHEGSRRFHLAAQSPCGLGRTFVSMRLKTRASGTAAVVRAVTSACWPASRGRARETLTADERRSSRAVRGETDYRFAQAEARVWVSTTSEVRRVLARGRLRHIRGMLAFVSGEASSPTLGWTTGRFRRFGDLRQRRWDCPVSRVGRARSGCRTGRRAGSACRPCR
jgi:hypothetical protein